MKYKGNVQIGSKIPPFSAELQNGEKIDQNYLMGHKSILFFYGQDDTPTCTKEACNIRDNYKAFTTKGYKVFGISKDNSKKHQKFISKYDLPYDLIADTELSMINAFGYYGPKIFMGKEVMGIYRTTVITDENGIVTHIIDNVTSADHSSQILNTLGYNEK